MGNSNADGGGNVAVFFRNDGVDAVKLKLAGKEYCVRPGCAMSVLGKSLINLVRKSSLVEVPAVEVMDIPELNPRDEVRQFAFASKEAEILSVKNAEIGSLALHLQRLEGENEKLRSQMTPYRRVHRRRRCRRRGDVRYSRQERPGSDGAYNPA